MNKQLLALGMAGAVVCATGAARAEGTSGFDSDRARFDVRLDAAHRESTVDYGPDCAGGYPAFEVSAAPAGGAARVRISYATHPDGLGPKGDFWRETRATYLGEKVDLPILPASVDRYDVFEVTTAGTYRARLQQGLVRHVKFVLEQGDALALSGFRLENRATHSEEPVVGSFTCSDARLDALWRASVRTCQLAAIPKRGDETTFAYLSDGAKRDRLVWSGDLWWGDLNMYYAFASDSPYMPGSVRMLALNQTPEGYTWACPYPETRTPPKSGEWGPFESDEFAAWLIPVARQLMLYTGDGATLRAVWPNLKKLDAYLMAHCRADGLFEQRAETSKNAGALRFGAESTHHRLYMDVLLWKCARDLGDLADWLGEDGAPYRARAAKRAATIRANYWDAAKGCFVRALEDRKMSPEGCALALACGFATKEEAARIVPQLKCIWHAKFEALSIRGCFAYGYGAVALAKIMEHNWLKVLDPKWKGCRLTYECMYPSTKGWGDEAHPDTAIAGAISAAVLGVRPTAPGWSEFVFDPQAPESITRAEGRVPTPHGIIEVKWWREGGELRRELRIPDGCRLSANR